MHFLSLNHITCPVHLTFVDLTVLTTGLRGELCRIYDKVIITIHKIESIDIPHFLPSRLRYRLLGDQMSNNRKSRDLFCIYRTLSQRRVTAATLDVPCFSFKSMKLVKI
jgi:hypothetical protein